MAQTVPSAFLLREVFRIEGEVVLLADCADYDAYKALPSVLSFEGKMFGLTGWNSDKGYACFKSGKDRIAWKVPF